MSEPLPAYADHFQEIYATRAAAYDRLVACEDAAGSIWDALKAVAEFQGARVAEFGAGTGRLTRLMAPHAATLRAFDASGAMLDMARPGLEGFPGVSLAVADHGSLPLEDGWADIAIEGWAFGHALSWHPEDWAARTDQWVEEMFRILRPGGTAILLETLGTGSALAEPPTEGLARLYGRWEGLGFRKQVLRTDFVFESLEEAQFLTADFFRARFAFETAGNRAALPECTGLWWMRKS